MKFNGTMMYGLESAASCPEQPCFPGTGSWPTDPSSSLVSQCLPLAWARALRLDNLSQEWVQPRQNHREELLARGRVYIHPLIFYVVNKNTTVSWERGKNQNSLPAFRTRNPTFSSYIYSCKFCGSPWLELLVFISIQGCWMGEKSEPPSQGELRKALPGQNAQKAANIAHTTQLGSWLVTSISQKHCG